MCRFPTIGPDLRTASPLALARALDLAGIDEVPGDEDRAVVGVLRQALQVADRMAAEQQAEQGARGRRQAPAPPGILTHLLDPVQPDIAEQGNPPPWPARCR